MVRDKTPLGLDGFVDRTIQALYSVRGINQGSNSKRQGKENEDPDFSRYARDFARQAQAVGLPPPTEVELDEMAGHTFSAPTGLLW